MNRLCIPTPEIITDGFESKIRVTIPPETLVDSPHGRLVLALKLVFVRKFSEFVMDETSKRLATTRGNRIINGDPVHGPVVGLRSHIEQGGK